MKYYLKLSHTYSLDCLSKSLKVSDNKCTLESKAKVKVNDIHSIVTVTQHASCKVTSISS